MSLRLHEVVDAIKDDIAIAAERRKPRDVVAFAITEVTVELGVSIELVGEKKIEVSCVGVGGGIRAQHTSNSASRIVIRMSPCSQSEEGNEGRELLLGD